ncbi:MAG: glutathione S-transferase family protein [Bdellovibrionales bacterium]|nr:glutathione S-transferase family protein [Bdellovibrionales bacterium]
MIQIYGSPKSSAGRCFLMLEECGLSYQVMPLDMGNKEHKAESFLKLNPNGKVPCIIDDGFVLWESAAIVQYLAQKYKPEMLGTSVKDKAIVQQWSFWTMTEAQPPLVDMLIQKVFMPADKRDHALIERCEKKLPNLFAVLENSLKNTKYLTGDTYTVADVMVASATNLALGLGIDFTQYPNIKSWMAEISSRPAWRKFAELRM